MYLRRYFPTWSCLFGDLQLDPAEPPQPLQPIDQLVEGLGLGGAAARGQERLNVPAAYRLQDFELFGRHPRSRARRQAAVLHTACWLEHGSR
jgi:hypothetical protein